MSINREDRLRPPQVDEAFAEWATTFEKLHTALDVGVDDAEKFHGEFDDFWEATLQLIECGYLPRHCPATVLAAEARTLKYHPNFPELWYA